jgi:hypothetical protein
MKAEHRHQLHTNALADRMGRFLQGMKSAPKSTSTLVWVFAILIVGTYGVWQYALSATAKGRSALWTSVDEATRNPSNFLGALERIESENPGSIAARSARFQLARWNMQQGLESVVGEPMRALPFLKQARKLYSDLIPDCVDTPSLAQEAMMGKATAEESLAGIVEPTSAEQTPGTENSGQTREEHAGSLDKALQEYRALANTYPDSILGKQAEQRAKQLDSSKSKVEQFYADAKQPAAPKVSPPAKSK